MNSFASGRNNRHFAGIFFLVFFLFLEVLSPFPGYPGENDLLGRVVDVIDGDTLEIDLDGKRERVRYLLIDTPELHHPLRGQEEFGRQAYRINRKLVLGKSVRLEFDVLKRDRYGRLLAYVWLEDNGSDILVNEELVRAGLSLTLTIPPNTRYENRISEAFLEARSLHRGFWKVARKRIFTAQQAWEELPYIRGNFITLETEIRKVLHQKDRKILLCSKGKCSLIIYNSDWEEFTSFLPFEGKKLHILGKIRSGYHGCEIILADPAQIYEFGP